MTPPTWIERENPARLGELVGRVPVASPADVAAAVARADTARRSPAPLSALLDAAVRLEHAARSGTSVRREDAGPGETALRRDGRPRDWTGGPRDDTAREEAGTAELLARETGKPVGDCRGELGFAAAFLRWVVEHAAEAYADREVDDAAGRLLLVRKPYGVVAALTPWNAPVILTLLKVGPALAAGNAVVVKPSPLAPLTVARVCGFFPEPLVQVVQGGAETGAALVSDPLVRKVAFTGGEAAGRAIGAAAGRMITPAVLELGGNDPAVFLDDAAFDDAAMERLVMASFATAGQVCMAAKRLYVPRARLGEFREAYVAAADRVLVLGDPLDVGTTVGPVVTAEAAARVRGLLGAGTAVPLGRVTCDLARGHYVRPALLLDLPDDAEAVAGEQFGPVVPLLAYDSEDEVLARANAGDLGLGASVWSADEDRAFTFARRVEAGFTFVNTHNRTGMSLRAPFGGVKRSGFGREYGVEGLAEYAQTCVVHAPAAFRAGGGGLAAGAYPA